MLGRSRHADRSTGAPDHPGYDQLDKYGAAVLYKPGVKDAYLAAPQNLTASPKASEHNTGNIPVRIVVAQLAGQTQPPALNRMISRRIVLRPGNQSIGGT